MSSLIQDQLKASGVAQVIVLLKPAVSLAVPAADGARRTRAVAHVSALVGMDAYFHHSELSLNSALAAAETVGNATTRRAQRRAPDPPSALNFPNLGLMLGTVTRESLASLRADPRVDRVESAPQLRLIKPTHIEPAKLTEQITWGINRLDVPKLWAQGLTGKGIRIGHLDTGVDGGHPALRKAIAAFAEFDNFGVQITPASAPHDTATHGTHTAGTIAGRPVKGQHIGVAPEAEVASAIVIEGGNVIARVLGGMDWAISQQVRLLNISLGIPFSPPLDEFKMILGILRSRGVLPVIAVGNEGPGTSRPPGNHPEALSVGSINEDGAVADTSSSQRFVRTLDPLVPDVVAPGVKTISAKPGGGYQSMNGTSMATPHITGLAALLMQAAPAATIDQIEQAIFASCSPAAIPPERGNRGLPNGVRALANLTGINLAGTTGGGTAPVKKPASKKGKTTTRKAAGKSSGKKGKGNN